MENVTAKKLESKFKGEGAERFAKIAELGGFGKVGDGESDLDTESNLDISGVLDPANDAVTPGDKNKIKELAGITEPKAEKSK